MKQLAILSLLILISCGPAAKLRRADRLIAQAKAQGAIVKRDSIVKYVPVVVKGDSGTNQINPDIDTTAFKKHLTRYDSLKDVNESLTESVRSGVNKEKALADLQRNNALLKKEISRLSKGFAKDSTYNFEDSLMIVSVELRDGQLTKIFHQVKDRKISVKQTTGITETISAPSDFWKWIALTLAAIIVIYIIIKKI